MAKKVKKVRKARCEIVMTCPENRQDYYINFDEFTHIKAAASLNQRLIFCPYCKEEHEVE